MSRATVKAAISLLTGYDGSCFFDFFVFVSSKKSCKLRMYVERREETAIPDKIHMTGASTSISRTITPWWAEFG